MRYGIDIATLGDFGEPENVVRLARAAEASGWEALFVWDHLAFAWGVPSTDPWITLAAVAVATERILLGPAVTPLPRRRPYVVAHAVATLDRLSGGRVILGVGLGGEASEFAAFGEPADAAVRAAMLDEGLAVVDGLLRGETVRHRGEYYTVEDVALDPPPRQQPRPAIWVGGESPPALRRAARWDGWIVGGDNEYGEMIRSPERIAEEIAYLRDHRDRDEPVTVAMTGVSATDDSDLFDAYTHAGVDWWLESIHGMRGSVEEMVGRIKAGPPEPTQGG